MNFAQPLSDDTLVSAAVRVVLPWSIWPMVPTFTCGLLRSNFSFATPYYSFQSFCPGPGPNSRNILLFIKLPALRGSSDRLPGAVLDDLLRDVARHFLVPV